LPPHLDSALVSCYRGWDLLEHTQPAPAPVIDFDLADPAPAESFTTREQVLTRLQELRQECRGLDLPGTLKELVSARILASQTYLKAVLGERLPLRAYVERTMGFTPEPFGEEALKAQLDIADQALAQITKKGALRILPEHALRFQKLFLIRDEMKLANHFAFYLAKWLPTLQSMLAQVVPGYLFEVDSAAESPSLQKWLVSSRASPREPEATYEIHVSFAEADAYWKNWISGNLAQGRIELRINVHQRHIWFAGAPEILVLHEYCGHAVQMMIWRHRIAQAQLPQFAGILTVHFPDQFTIEGLAESLPYLLPDYGGSLEKKSTALRELQHYSLLVLNNAHLLANEDDGLEKAIAYASKRLPFTSRALLERDLSTRRSHPLFRTYQYVYGVAKHRILRAFASLDRSQAIVLLRLLYTEPMLPQHFQKARRHLAA
jgi:hypothetical protein